MEKDPRTYGKRAAGGKTSINDDDQGEDEKSNYILS